MDNLRDPKLAGSDDAGLAVGKLRGSIISIQFLRFVAASLVVFVHASEVLHGRISGSISKEFLKNAFFGASGVHIFFVISGFIMVYTSFYGKDIARFSASKFLFRRFFRIYPIYIVYCALYLAFYHVVLGTSPLSWGELVGSLALFPGDSSRIIGPGWTLGFEVYFYFCFSIAMMIGMRRGILALTIFFLLSIIVRPLADTSQHQVFVFTNSLLIEFLMGAWVGYAVASGVTLGNFLSKTMIVVALCGFLAGIFFGFHRLPSVVTWGVPSALLVAGLVFSESNGYVPQLIKKFAPLGDSSYSLYLLHVLLLDAAVLAVMTSSVALVEHIQRAGAIEMIAICSALSVYCIVVAHFSYQLIERNLVNGLRHLLPARKILRLRSGKSAVKL